MRRLIDFFEFELAVLEAVLSRRIRSLVLLGAAFIIPSIFLLAAIEALQGVPLPGLVDGFRPMLGLMALVLMLKLMWLAARAYREDRAALLRF